MTPTTPDLAELRRLAELASVLPSGSDCPTIRAFGGAES